MSPFNIYIQSALSRINPWWGEVVLNAMLRFDSPDIYLAMLYATFGALTTYAVFYSVGWALGKNLTVQSRIAISLPRIRSILPILLVIVPFTAFCLPVIIAAGVYRLPIRYATIALVLGEGAVRLWMMR